MIELSKYVLEVLRKDKEFNLYRGRSENHPSQILVLSPVVEYPAPESLKRLEHEYSLREELDPAWAARPMAVARHWDRTVLVLEDPGGVPIDQLLGRPSDLAFSLQVAIGLAIAIRRRACSAAPAIDCWPSMPNAGSRPPVSARTARSI